MTLVSQVDSVTFTDIIVSTSSPGGCSDSHPLEVTLRNPCQLDLSTSTHTSFALPASIPPQTVYLNQASSYHPGPLDDSVSLANGDPTFCGLRELEFKDTSDGSSLTG